VKANVLIEMIRSGQLPLMVRLTGLVKPLYRACFVSAAASHGVLRLLGAGPQPLSKIAEALGASAPDLGLLEAWLDLGVRLGELGRRGARYQLRGSWSRKLADPRHDLIAAMLEEAVRHHYDALLGVPAMLKGERPRFTLADQDAELVARTSRILDPFLREAIDLVLPRTGAMRLLEVGCGEGGYVQYACERNRDLGALAIDVQPAVAQVARERLARAGLADRAQVLAGDVRTLQLEDASFDLATLHNVIYYFRVEDRVPLLERLRGLLARGGRLLVTTGCRGGNLALDFVDLCLRSSEVGGAFPTSPEEIAALLRAAGFSRVQAHSLIPGDRYYAFVAERAA